MSGPAPEEKVKEKLGEVGNKEEVFAIVYINDGYYYTYWSRPGEGFSAHGHAEWVLCQALGGARGTWPGELRIDITLKFSPCSLCAMQLISLKQMLDIEEGELSYIKIYYLEEYLGKGGVGNSREAMRHLGWSHIICKPYNRCPNGYWWDESTSRKYHTFGKI